MVIRHRCRYNGNLHLFEEGDRVYMEINFTLNIKGDG